MLSSDKANSNRCYDVFTCILKRKWTWTLHRANTLNVLVSNHVSSLHSCVVMNEDYAIRKYRPSAHAEYRKWCFGNDTTWFVFDVTDEDIFIITGGSVSAVSFSQPRSLNQRKTQWNASERQMVLSSRHISNRSKDEASVSIPFPFDAEKITPHTIFYDNRYLPLINHWM